MNSARSSRRRGVVLIVVLGVLAVLALLATAFATLQATERHIARNYEDTVRAKLLAMSGVEFAVSRLTEAGGTIVEPAMTYWGNNTKEEGSPDWATPLERALSPSYALEEEPVQDPTNGIVQPIVVTIDGVPVGLTGVMGQGSYGINSDVFRVRVTDANSLIYLNDGLEQGREGTTSKNLQRILNNLGEQLGAKKLGDQLLDRRPPGGYLAKRELDPILGSALSAKVQAFVTTRAWVDRSVANPVPFSRETLSSYPVKYHEKLGLFRYGRSFGTGGAALTNFPLKFAPEHADPRGVEHAIIAMDELNPQWIEMTRRAPINVNLAPKEILISVIAGLRGVFLAERRKSNPHPWNLYSFMAHPTYDNSPGGRRGDEFGYLYSTLPFVGATGTVTEGVSAAKVAEEIIACRTKKPSPGCAGVDYGKIWYGGPFKSWRQFNAFCDGLVAGELLRDERPIFYDFQSSKKGGGAHTGPDDLVPSSIQRRFAAQAMADVLKANFNPNLTLNEANADFNLFQAVDKTDLLTCSTEFCFSPMGIFEIESEGIVTAPPGRGDLLYFRHGAMVARKKIFSVAKVFDVHRESSQADFHEGTLDGQAGGAATDNGKGLVVGPEPDIADVARDCKYSGWIQLSTVGGPTGHAGPERGAAAHGHFSKSCDLHHHASGGEKPIRSAGALYRNNRDRTEGAPGPYEPGLTGRHRLGRSWQGLELPKGAEYIAPSDLRIDGAYVERDSALLYENSAAIFGLEGTVSYWIKPSYAPEMTGKPRTYFCVDQTFKQFNPKTTVQLMHGQWFFASHDAEADAASPNETAPMTYSQGPWVPMSMAAGYSTHESYGGAVGKVSPSLNHRAHADKSKLDLLRRNGWTHIAYYWNMNKHEVTLLINGQIQPQTRAIKVHPQKFNQVADFLQAPMRIGEPSTTMSLSGRESRNWSADATIDEFYIWKGNHLDDAQEFWSRGRYYVPRSGREAVFTSRPLDLVPRSRRDVAPSRAGVTVTASTPQVRILGASWTWYPEAADKNGQPTVIDHQTGDSLEARVNLTMVLNDTPVGAPMRNDGGSDVHVTANPGDVLKYRLNFHLPAAEADAILLSTPVVDDVSIFYTTGTKYLYYELCGGGL